MCTTIYPCSSCCVSRSGLYEASLPEALGLRKHYYNKAIGGDRIRAELFQVLKMMLLKCHTQYASKFGKLSSGHRTGKSQFSF